MRSRLTVLVVHLLGAIAFRFVYETESKPFFPGRIPNGDKVLIKKTGEYCFGVGHVSCSGGGALNAFGVDFNAAGQVWTKELCMMDSDGDMYSNGEELGDPCCVWTAESGVGPRFSSTLGHPGVADSEDFGEAPEPVSCDEPITLGESGKQMTNPGETSFDMVMKIEHTVQPVVTEYVDFQFNFRSADGSPLMGVAYMVGFEVEIDHDEHVHHFVGYTCPREHDESSNGKSREDLGCEMQFLTWAPGSNRLAFPSDVALPVGPGTSHRSCSIEVHYDNPDKVSGVSDSSLVKLIMVTSPRAHDAAFLNLGDQILISNKMIPAGQPSWGVTSRCLVETVDDQEVTIFAHFPHMHWVGKRLWSEVIATGGIKDGASQWSFAATSEGGIQPIKSLGRIDAYDADLQRTYLAGNGNGYFSVKTGDLIATTCVYDTSGKTQPVYGGLGSEDEMCIHFMMYYPASAITNFNCGMKDGALAGEWPEGFSSIVQKPEFLAKLLEPNPGSPFGYETTLKDLGGDDGGDGDESQCDHVGYRAACGADARLPRIHTSAVCESYECVAQATACDSIVSTACQFKGVFSDGCADTGFQLTHMQDPSKIFPSDVLKLANNICSNTCKSELYGILENYMAVSGPDPIGIERGCCIINWMAAGCSSVYPGPAAPSGPGDVLMGAFQMNCDVAQTIKGDLAKAEGLGADCRDIPRKGICKPAFDLYSYLKVDANYTEFCGLVACTRVMIDTCLPPGVLEKLADFVPDATPDDLESRLWALQGADIAVLVAEVCPLVPVRACRAAMAECGGDLGPVYAGILPVEWMISCLNTDQTPALPFPSLPSPPPPSPPPPSPPPPTPSLPSLEPTDQVIVVHSTVAFPDLSAGALSTDSSKNLLKKNIADGAGVPPAWVAILSIAAGRAEVHYAVAFPAANVEMAEKFHETAKLSPSDVFDDSFGAAKTISSEVSSTAVSFKEFLSEAAGSSDSLGQRQAEIFITLLLPLLALEMLEML